MLVLAGDIDLATAKAKTLEYFGDIPASATVPKLPPTSRRARKPRVNDDRPRRAGGIYRAWNIPEFGNPDVDACNGRAHPRWQQASRLDRRLVHPGQAGRQRQRIRDGFGSELGLRDLAKVRSGAST